MENFGEITVMDQFKCPVKECTSDNIIFTYEGISLHCSRFHGGTYTKLTGTKWCPKCQTIKSADRFRKNKSQASGLVSYCKDCRDILDPVDYEKLRNRDRNKDIGRRYNLAIGLAKKHKREWSISFELFSKLMQEKCHYCHWDLNTTGYGLDRVNNDLGYIPDNVLPCCAVCNAVKSNILNYDEMVEVGLLIDKFKQKRLLKKVTQFTETKFGENRL